MSAAAGLSQVIAGAYTAVWNGLDIGQVTTDGYKMRYRTGGYDITADTTGEGTVVDSIYNGLSMTIDFVAEHWNAQAIEQLLWWFGNTGASYSWGRTDGVGMRMFDAAKPLVLTACHIDGTGLDALPSNPYIDPLDITWPRAILAPNQDIEFLMSTKPRFLPISVMVFPVDTGFSPATPTTSERVSNCSNMIYFVSTRNPQMATLATNP